MSCDDYEDELKSADIVNESFLESKWRVKLYKLNTNGQWDDRGTGHVTIIKEVNKTFTIGRGLCFKNGFRNRQRINF